MNIGYVIFEVSDFDRSLVFYRDHLGLKLVESRPDQKYARFKAGGVDLRIKGGHAPAPAEHGSVGFLVDDLDALYADLSKKGVEFPAPPARKSWGAYQATVKDPDGHLFYLEPVPEG